jgi:hypothetical protein
MSSRDKDTSFWWWLDCRQAMNSASTAFSSLFSDLSASVDTHRYGVSVEQVDSTQFKAHKLASSKERQLFRFIFAQAFPQNALHEICLPLCYCWEIIAHAMWCESLITLCTTITSKIFGCHGCDT